MRAEFFFSFDKIYISIHYIYQRYLYLVIKELLLARYLYHCWIDLFQFSIWFYLMRFSDPQFKSIFYHKNAVCPSNFINEMKLKEIYGWYRWNLESHWKSALYGDSRINMQIEIKIWRKKMLNRCLVAQTSVLHIINLQISVEILSLIFLITDRNNNTRTLFQLSI